MILLAFAGCGDDLETSPADARQVADASIDGGTIQCDPPAAGAPGSPCSEPEDCDSAAEAGDGRCLNADHRGVIWPETGYCVRICEEAASDCGSGTTCFAQEGAAQVLCMPTCCDGDACADGFACSTTFLGQEVGAAICMPGDPSASDGDACTSVADCPANSNCLVDEGGVCAAMLRAERRSPSTPAR